MPLSHLNVFYLYLLFLVSAFLRKNYPSVSEPFFCEHTMKASWSKEAVYEPPYFNREIKSLCTFLMPFL